MRMLLLGIIGLLGATVVVSVDAFMPLHLGLPFLPFSFKEIYMKFDGREIEYYEEEDDMKCRDCRITLRKKRKAEPGMCRPERY